MQCIEITIIIKFLFNILYLFRLLEIYIKRTYLWWIKYLPYQLLNLYTQNNLKPKIRLSVWVST